MVALPRLAQPGRDWIKLVYIWLTGRTLFVSFSGFKACFASLRSAWKGLDQSCLHLTHLQHIICINLRILGPLYLASLVLEGIRSSSFIFDSLVAHFLFVQDSVLALPYFAWSKWDWLKPVYIRLTHGTLFAFPQDSMATLPCFAWPGRDWIKLVYIWLSRGT